VLPRGERRFAVLYDDVTDRRRAEEDLRESQRRLQMATEAAALGIFDLDLLSGVVAWDERVRELWGAEHEKQGSLQALLEGVHEDERQAVRTAIETSLEPSRAGSLNLTFRVVDRKDSTVRWIHASGQVQVEEGEAARLVGTVEDVTDRIRAERALSEHNAAQAAQEERSRLARDLHDSVTQALFAASLKAEALAAGMESDAAAARAEEVRRLNRGALAQMRTLLLELRGDPIPDVPIQQLLRSAVDATESRASVVVSLSVRGQAEMPDDVHEAVYRITQEALNNVTRHARAETARVELAHDAAGVRLTISDDGRGFDRTDLAPGRFGLASMREHALQSGGELDVESSVGKGTTVTAEWRLTSF
jgi:PAS domain S-box-containing protein